MQENLVAFLFSPWCFLPISLGFSIGVWSFLSLYNVRKRKISLPSRRKRLERIQSFVPLLPLSGLLGTVYSMASTLYFMGESTGQLHQNIDGVIVRFAPALGTTFWGIVLAMLLQGFIQLKLYDLDLSEEE